jgi:hypothetical protein
VTGTLRDALRDTAVTRPACRQLQSRLTTQGAAPRHQTIALSARSSLLTGRSFAGSNDRTRRRGEGVLYVPPWCFVHPKSRASWLGPRWRVQGRPAVRGPAGTGSVGDSVGEGGVWQGVACRCPHGVLPIRGPELSGVASARSANCPRARGAQGRRYHIARGGRQLLAARQSRGGAGLVKRLVKRASAFAMRASK